MSCTRNTSGGSLMYRPLVNYQSRKSKEHQKIDAIQRATEILGENCVQALQQKWTSLNTHLHGQYGNGDMADDILTCLQKCSLSNIMIQSILRCGGL